MDSLAIGVPVLATDLAVPLAERNVVDALHLHEEHADEVWHA